MLGRFAELESLSNKLNEERREFDYRVISYKELQNENAILRQDLRNLGIQVRKLDLDRRENESAQTGIADRVEELGARYLKENVKWISASLTPNNFANMKQRLMAVVERCRGIGIRVTDAEEADLIADLRAQYEMVVRAAFQREEQTRIRAQIREEQAREREIDRELKRVANERAAIEAALTRAIADARDEFSEEVERLKQRLAEAEARAQRALSQAQLTKSGHVYVISNIGSFGEGVFKVGMTRRLEPLDRVRELGDASVPFPFDIHMMIACDDAPSLENALHRRLHKSRLNKCNPRKEFFRADINTILDVVKEHHGDVQYVADAEALEFRQTESMTDDDQEFIEHVYDELEDEGAPTMDDL